MPNGTGILIMADQQQGGLGGMLGGIGAAVPRGCMSVESRAIAATVAAGRSPTGRP